MPLSDPPLEDRLHRHVWQALADIYGAKFTSSFGDDPAGPAGRRWARAMAGFSVEMLAHGIKACESTIDGWIDLPTFKARCFGIPAFHTVSFELMERNRPKSRFSRLVWSMLPGGEYRYRQAHPEKAERYLRQAYDCACDHVMAGGSLPMAIAGELDTSPPRAADQAQPSTPESQARAAEARAKAEAILRDPDPAPAAPPEQAQRAKLEREVAAMSEVELLTYLIEHAVRQPSLQWHGEDWTFLLSGTPTFFAVPFAKPVGMEIRGWGLWKLAKPEQRALAEDILVRIKCGELRS